MTSRQLLRGGTNRLSVGRPWEDIRVPMVRPVLSPKDIYVVLLYIWIFFFRADDNRPLPDKYLLLLWGDHLRLNP
mgnify:CR=1 FL=1